jgi:hypothetical protein
MNRNSFTKVIGLGAVVASSFMAPAAAFADGPTPDQFPTETIKMTYGVAGPNGPQQPIEDLSFHYNKIVYSQTGQVSGAGAGTARPKDVVVMQQTVKSPAGHEEVYYTITLTNAR